MQIRNAVATIWATAALAAVAGCTTTAPQVPASWDGLEVRPTKGLDAVYVRPGAEFKAYRSVIFDPVQVAFDKSWDPNRTSRGVYGGVSASDVERIKGEMASELRKVFVEELAGGGYQVVEAAAEDTLRVSAGLADVYINAPDTMSPGRSTTYTMDPGRMTLVMELRDAPTGQLLARVVDRKAGASNGFLQVANSVTNSADFRRAAREWAQKLRAGLDKINGRAG